jgi:hypothetical protein
MFEVGKERQGEYDEGQKRYKPEFHQHGYPH